MQVQYIDLAVAARPKTKETYANVYHTSNIHTSHQYAPRKKINCSTKSEAIDKLVSANKSQMGTLSIHRIKHSTNLIAPLTISTKPQKCAYLLNLRAIEKGAGLSESAKRRQKDRSIRGSNPGPFPTLQRSAAPLMLSPGGFYRSGSRNCKGNVITTRPINRSCNYTLIAAI